MLSANYSLLGLYMLAGASLPERTDTASLCVKSEPVAVEDILIPNPKREDYARMSATLERLDQTKQFLRIADPDLESFDAYRRKHFPLGAESSQEERAVLAIEFENQIARSISNLILCSTDAALEPLGKQAQSLMQKWEDQAKEAIAELDVPLHAPERKSPPQRQPLIIQP